VEVGIWTNIRNGFAKIRDALLLKLVFRKLRVVGI